MRLWTLKCGFLLLLPARACLGFCCLTGMVLRFMSLRRTVKLARNIVSRAVSKIREFGSTSRGRQRGIGFEVCNAAGLVAGNVVHQLSCLVFSMNNDLLSLQLLYPKCLGTAHVRYLPRRPVSQGKTTHQSGHFTFLGVRVASSTV